MEERELLDKVGELRDAIAIKAQNIVHKIMPSKVLTLDELMHTSPLFVKPLSEIEKPDFPSILSATEYRSSRQPPTFSGEDAENGPAPKRRKMSSGYIITSVSIPSNKCLNEAMSIVKRELIELSENVNVVKVWIQLNIPRIEGGDNFGVEIQEETVGELGRAEDNAFSLLEQMTKYYVSRAKLVSKVLKYPEIEDYKQSIRELDEKEWINMRLCVSDLRNNYAILYDIVIKNLENLKMPRNTNHMDSLL